MKNMFAYLSASPMPNLYDYCCDYIENANLPSGAMAANEKTYNICVEYINGDISDNKREYLKNQFGLL